MALLFLIGPQAACYRVAQERESDWPIGVLSDWMKQIVTYALNHVSQKMSSDEQRQ